MINVFGGFDNVCSRLFDHSVKKRRFSIDFVRRAFEFDDQNCRRIFRVARTDRRLGRVHREPVHDLHRSGEQPGRHHHRNSVPRLLKRIVRRLQRVKLLWQRQQSQRDFQSDAEQAFAADEHPRQILTDRFQTVAAKFDDLAIGQHDLDAQHMVRRHSVLQTVSTAGIESDVSANRADRPAGRIRSVIQPVCRHVLRNLQIDNARLDNGDPLLGVVTENRIQPVQRDDQAVFNRNRSTTETRPAASRDEWHFEAMTQFDSVDDFLLSFGQNDSTRLCAETRQPVGFVRRELSVVCQNSVRRIKAA